MTAAITAQLRQEILQIRQEIMEANNRLLDAWHQFDRMGAANAGELDRLAASGVSLAAERLRQLLRREAETTDRIRKGFGPSRLSGTELDCLIEVELAAG